MGLPGLRETTALLAMEADVPQAFRAEASTGMMKIVKIVTNCSIQYQMENMEAIPGSNTAAEVMGVQTVR